MKILFDQGVPVPIRLHLNEHIVSTVYELGWTTLENGELIGEAESSGFDLFVSTDKNLQYQQNISDRRISIAILPTTSWPKLQKQLHSIVKTIGSAVPGQYIER